jgi:hypothetical protein
VSAEGSPTYGATDRRRWARKRGWVSLQHISRQDEERVLANVKPERAYNPFPREGLVKAFEPFIRKEVEEYCKQNRHVPGTDMLIEAVRLATLAEARFKPALGNSFSTFVHYRLKELHRFAENYSGGQSVPSETAAARALREAAEAGGPIEPMQLGGGNSTPMLFDWQWMRSLLKRQRIEFGFRGHGGMNVHRLADRLQELRGMPWGRPPDAAVFAAADHLFRRQREERRNGPELDRQQ